MMVVGEWSCTDADVHRVNRGGSWNNHPRNLRAAVRNGNHPGNRWNNHGFRMCRAPRLASTPVSDPTAVQFTACGDEDPKGLGVEVGTAERYSNRRRVPAFDVEVR